MSYSQAAGQKNCSHILNNVSQLAGLDQGSSTSAALPPYVWRGPRLAAIEDPGPSLSYRLLFVWLFALIFVALSSACAPGSQLALTTTRTESTATARPTPAALNSTNDPRIAKALDALLDSPEYSTARWGVAVLSLDDGKLLYARNADKLFTPASNMKVYTTAVALDLLGADYRWRTSVYSNAEPDANGTVNGDLVLYGRGAPDLTAINRNDNTNSLETLATSLANRGVKHIKGNVVGDESYFRGEAVGEGWQWNDLQWYFGAEASALSVNANSTDLSITPPAKVGDQPSVATSDQDDYFQITNNLAAVERGAKFTLGVKRGISDNNIVVWGDFPPGAPGYGASLSVHRPALWAARLFTRALRDRGIIVDGNAVARDSNTAGQNRFKPEQEYELTFTLSKSLAEIARVTNKHSINLYAELILRTLGRERGAMDPEKNIEGRERGDEESGTSIVKLWLSKTGVETDKLAIHDGSGLSRLDLVTPEATARLLYAVRHAATGQVFLDSLPIAGTDGTLRGRLAELSGKVFAKTGALTYDHSLSGYLKTAENKTLVFSIVLNDFVQKEGAIPLVDRLVRAIASSSSAPATDRNLKQFK